MWYSHIMKLIASTFLEMPLGSQITFILVLGILIYTGAIKIKGFSTSKKPHEGCKHKIDLVSIVREGVRLYHKTIKLKYIDTLYEQMTKLEIVHSNITLKMLQDYRDLGASAEDVAHYRSLIYKMENNLKNYFRKWFKENHFNEKSDNEFIHYIKEKLELIQKIIIGDLNDNYTGYTIPRDILREDNLKNLVPYIQDQYTKLFYEVRDISKESHKKITELENSLTDLTGV